MVLKPIAHHWCDLVNTLIPGSIIMLLNFIIMCNPVADSDGGEVTVRMVPIPPSKLDYINQSKLQKNLDICHRKLTRVVPHLEVNLECQFPIILADWHLHVYFFNRPPPPPLWKNWIRPYDHDANIRSSRYSSLELLTKSRNKMKWIGL